MSVAEKQLAPNPVKSLQAWHLQAIVESATISVCDHNGTIRYANDNFLELTGFRLGELIGESHRLLNSGHHPKDFFRHLNETIFSGITWSGEIRNRKKSGVLYWVHMTIIPICNSSGEVEEFLTFSHEITDRKRTEASLEKSLEWNSAVLESTTHAVISTNIQGKISTFNGAAERLLGYRARDVIDRASFSVENAGRSDPDPGTLSLAGEALPLGTFEKAMSAVLATGAGRAEWTAIRRDGSRIPLRVAISCLRDHNGDVFGYLATAEDLSEQKALAALIESQKNQMITSAKLSSLGEVTSGIAHEINNPLAIITGKASLLRKKVAEGNASQALIIGELDKIESTSDRIAKIVNGLRSISRNSDEDPMAPVRVESVIRETLEICRERFRLSGVAMDLDLGDGLVAMGRPAQLSQVFMNLITNAFDAIAELPEKWVRISATNTDKMITVRVTDSGRGIAPPIAEKLMRPFFTTKTVGKGTGLGLSISKDLIALHGGELCYDATSPNTSFTVTLPAAAP